jgi:hypothetical protein
MKILRINGKDIEISKEFWLFVLGTVAYVEGFKYMDLSFITRTTYFQGDYPMGAMLYLMMFSVVKTIATYACFGYVGYHIGRYYEKRDESHHSLMSGPRNGKASATEPKISSHKGTEVNG